MKGTLTQSGVSDNFRMPVPIYLDLSDGKSEKIARFASVSMVGNATKPFEVVLPQKPKRVLINYLFDVLAQK